MNLEQAFTSHRVLFDPEDKANNGLYLCLPENMPTTVDRALLERLMSADLWTRETVKTVREEQKPDYIAQLDCEEALPLDVAEGTVIALATDHPKFPLDRSRWEAWKRVLQS